MRAVLFGLVLVLAATAAAFAAPRYANVTIMTWDPGHGTQVEYYDSAGQNFLWYPGNNGVVRGQWKIENVGGKVDMLCFSYQGNGHTPVTGHRGSGWECMPLVLHERGIVDRKKGDVFGLAGGSVPFILTRTRTTIAGLRKGPVPEAPKPAPLSAAELCTERLAGANGSREEKISAAILHYHGKSPGEPCVKVDYVKAFALLREAGDSGTFASLLKDLEQKAASGNPRAVAALERVDTSPIVR